MEGGWCEWWRVARRGYQPVVVSGGEAVSVWDGEVEAAIYFFLVSYEGVIVGPYPPIDL